MGVLMGQGYPWLIGAEVSTLTEQKHLWVTPYLSVKHGRAKPGNTQNVSSV
jgi:hypothetical protein